MTTDTLTAADPRTPRGADVMEVMNRACARIAPTWPLDRFIAVNPFWEMIDEPIARVSATLTAFSGARLLMPRAWFREQWRNGRLRDEDLAEAITQSGSSVTVAEMHALMESDEPVVRRRARVADVADSLRDLGHEMSWRDFIAHSASQFCASYFDDGQARLGPSREGGLYASWRRHALQDRSPLLLMGDAGYPDAARRLPRTAREMAQLALEDLDIPSHEREPYLTGLLLDLNGWAAWCAYRRWTARLSGGHDDHIVDLLAVHLAWEWMLLRSRDSALVQKWRGAMAEWSLVDARARSSQIHDWLLQDAVERAYQNDICRRISAGFGIEAKSEPVRVQAAFCIDVRSEVFRRALEAESADIETLGFAGFFGMPIEYQPVASPKARPQLPGLLAPRFRVTDAGVPTEVEERRVARLDVASAWKNFKSNALSSFAFVESLGVVFGGTLLAETLGRGTREVPNRAGLTAREDEVRKPRLTSFAGGGALGVEERCALAEGILRAMSLTRKLAPLVVLLGHGSQTRNNPHAAGLDCGACGGQTGEVNARAAAALLNDPNVRSGLSARGIEVPSTTRFVSGLHDTTTDRVTLYDLDELPPSHQRDVALLVRRLEGAGARVRRERSARLGLSALSDEALRRATDDRARDWAQVRPEWGLADNAAFIVARRARSRHLDLGGRAFLHDYRYEEDEDGAILELIMTAPMIVTHWINLQYYASTVDNPRYGSGNKVLHNVVGGHLGVFEGNGGDLRIGLPIQSLHDGARWMHTPLRLSVFIEAPLPAIDGVVRKHGTVRTLVDNEWLHLFQLDAEAGVVRAYRGHTWTALAQVEG